MAETYQELQKLSDEELIKECDDRAKQTDFQPDFYLDELNRRRQDRLTKQIKNMTAFIAVLTGVVTLATLVNVAFFVRDVLT